MGRVVAAAKGVLLVAQATVDGRCSAAPPRLHRGFVTSALLQLASSVVLLVYDAVVVGLPGK